MFRRSGGLEGGNSSQSMLLTLSYFSSEAQIRNKEIRCQTKIFSIVLRYTCRHKREMHGAGG